MRLTINCMRWSFLILLLFGCAYLSKSTKGYDEIPAMLTVVTNIAQSAVEQGYFQKGERAVLEYIAQKKPNLTKWFEENGYEIRVAEVADHAVAMVCDDGKPILEDTYCNSGYPDKDHRRIKNESGCKITMTVEEVRQICR